MTPRWIRNLTTNELRRGSQALRDANLCRDRFATPERWNEFKHDVAFFREQLGPHKWREVQMDHGYNASPVWTVVGRTLANTGPASTRQIDRLWWLDPLLILAMWATVWWAFGWRVVSVAVIWWGTNYAAPYNFIGGAFLRQDWLFLAIAGICLVKRGWPAIGGFALAWSTLLRIFPGFILLGLFLKIAADSWRTRRLAVTPAHLRFAGGAILALIVWIPPTLTLGGGETDRLSPWKGFVQNTRKLASSQMTNSVGLPVAIAFSPANRIERVRQYWLDSPWDVWKAGTPSDLPGTALSLSRSCGRLRRPPRARGARPRRLGGADAGHRGDSNPGGALELLLRHPARPGLRVAPLSRGRSRPRPDRLSLESRPGGVARE